MFADPQVKHLAMAPTVTHHARGDIKVVGQPLVLERTPAALCKASPDAGEHTDEVLKQAGYDQSQIEGLRKNNVV